MENISYHKWATTIVMNCLCRASNSRSQTPESLDYSSCPAVVEDKWKERLQSFATISLHASIVQWNSQETLESDFLSSKHGRGSS